MEPIKHGFKASEVIESGRVTCNQISVLRQWIAQERLPDLTDEQLILFSLSCFNNLDDTKKTINAFVTIRNGCPALFSNRMVLAKELQEQLGVVDLCVFPQRTSDDCVVIFHQLRETNFRRYNMETAMKLLFMTLDAAIYDHPPKGLVILFDMKGVGLLHLTRVRLGLVQVFFHYLQEALPVRLKKIHVLNSVYFLEKVIGIIKPFVKKEVMEMINFYPVSMPMNEFYAHLSKEHLPEDLGGSLPTIRVLHERNVHKLTSMQTYFDAEEKQRKIL
ncbi:hypothetical protein RN001_011255 [Aquatica leii]|uniref:CRAL-TRIO domain-containing protein n=1 Tax=Aquatica leii TaxID=1421715 RepID=A0AAN7PVS9_9COLE|nr:hypothetical protein RN001_011255 [Aquatica leii]